MRESSQFARSVLVGVVVALCSATRDSAAQIAPRLDLGGNIEVGGEAERYLRALQVAGRALAPTGAHPWSARFAPANSAAQLGWLRPEGRLLFNSGFPFQSGHGPTWAGRGATAELQAGFTAQWSRVRLQFAPVAFIAQNSPFTLAPNGQSGRGSFADARFPGNIDYPQRFGSASYGRIDLGTSTLSLDLPGVAVGVSNAPQRWGPAIEYPLVLGPGAGGFPHAYIGTSAPVNLWLFKLHARLIAGTLAQSDYSAGAGDRFASAMMFSITPRGIAGLELGFIRFFETNDRASLRHVLRPFSGLISGQSNRSVNIAGENQTASAFMRWVLPAAGVELYGEFYREDYPGNFRWFLEKPDDLSSYTLGLQRVFASGAQRVRVFRAELVNGELSHQERGYRGAAIPIPPYTHGEVVQGHTQRGLLLGSPEAYGGAGWRITLDEFTERGRSTIAVERVLRFDWLPGQAANAPDIHPDVLYAVRLEVLRFRGGRDYTFALVPAIDLNRNLQRGQDRFNLHASVTVRGVR